MRGDVDASADAAVGMGVGCVWESGMGVGCVCDGLWQVEIFLVRICATVRIKNITVVCGLKIIYGGLR